MFNFEMVDILSRIRRVHFFLFFVFYIRILFIDFRPGFFVVVRAKGQKPDRAGRVFV